MPARIRVSKNFKSMLPKLDEWLAVIPADAVKMFSTALQDVINHYELKSLDLELRTTNWTLYCSEDYRYTTVYQDKSGEWTTGSVQMAAAHNIGGSGMHSEIGAQIPIPFNSFLIEVWYRYDAQRPWGCKITRTVDLQKQVET